MERGAAERDHALARARRTEYQLADAAASDRALMSSLIDGRTSHPNDAGRRDRGVPADLRPPGRNEKAAILPTLILQDVGVVRDIQFVGAKVGNAIDENVDLNVAPGRPDVSEREHPQFGVRYRGLCLLHRTSRRSQVRDQPEQECRGDQSGPFDC